jgi:SAM-dependent methyltransferase
MRRHYKLLGRSVIRVAATVMGRVLPLRVRKALVASRAGRVSRGGLEFAVGLLHDLRRRDAVEFHRFLWSNHLAYAATYEVDRRFGAHNLNPSRRILLRDMAEHLRSRGLDERRHIRSVLDVGCSLGYLLRHLEVGVCPSADVLHGLDIDEYAVKAGMAHLSSLQSKVKLFVGDMTAAGGLLGERTYDVILCCGVLMYGDEQSAHAVVRTMLARANCLVGIIALADSAIGVRGGRSMARHSDGAFIHDVDRMIRHAGGRVVAARHIDKTVSGSNACRAILAEPGHGPLFIPRPQ